MKEAGEPFDAKNYLPAVAGYYTDSKGNMLSLPSQLDSGVLRQLRMRSKMAGLDGTAPKPGRIRGRCRQAEGRRAAVRLFHLLACVGARREFQAWHNLPIGTGENGIAGTTTNSGSILRST